MELILLKKVDKLGGLGDKVHVRGGYGRNYLIPTGRAVAATPANLEAFEARRAELERELAAARATAEAAKERLEALTVTIARRAGDEGRLFGSVGTADIAEAVQQMGQELAREDVRLPNNNPLRTTGAYEVEVRLHTEVTAVLKVEVVAEA
jgi:large subunit ribosomal protein L9